MFLAKRMFDCYMAKLAVYSTLHNLKDIIQSFCWCNNLFVSLICMLSQVEVPDRKSICPDRPRRKVSMSRPSQTESAYVQTFVRSKFFVRSSCVQKSSCPDFRAFKIAYVQTFVRSKRKFVRSKFNNLCVHVQTIVRSKGLMSRLSCVQKCLCPDFRAFQKKIRALQK